MKQIQQKIGVGLCFFFVFATVGPSLSLIRPLFAANNAIQEKSLSDAGSSESSYSATEESSAQAVQRGGIYKVGRAFKKAGGGIKKGFLVTGRTFKKVGSSIKNFFTGKKPEEEPQFQSQKTELENSKLDQVGEVPETQPSKS